ncbi:unnamed protein product [Phaedon cochleariae]|uniref:C2H2-type domain-containing protein n=1 Tax=Phaedon cochleariae TaxID=80249 RepID=A0A9N9X0F9_PHACE|nr:unnamed protein product [Phaedon cochleariae]
MGLKCIICETKFTTRTNLNKHMKNIHKLKPTTLCYDSDRSKWKNKCLEKGCNNSFRNNTDLINHLSESHDIKIESEEIEFVDKDEFLDWKSDIEKTFKSNYAITSGYSKDQPVTYYSCNRSGKIPSRGSFKRRGKIQGSCKLNSRCTSMIKLMEGTNKLSVTWVKTHYGHTTELEHLRISKTEKSIIASKLFSGVPPSRILDSYRNNIDEDDPYRENFITRKDILNIKNSLKKTKPSNLQENKRENKLPREVNKPVNLKKTLLSKIMNIRTKLRNKNISQLDDEVTILIEGHLDTIDELLDLPCTSSTSYCNLSDDEPALPAAKRRELKNSEIHESNFGESHVSHSATDDHSYFESSI